MQVKFNLVAEFPGPKRQPSWSRENMTFERNRVISLLCPIFYLLYTYTHIYRYIHTYTYIYVYPRWQEVTDLINSDAKSTEARPERGPGRSGLRSM